MFARTALLSSVLASLSLVACAAPTSEESDVASSNSAITAVSWQPGQSTNLATDREVSLNELDHHRPARTLSPRAPVTFAPRDPS